MNILKNDEGENISKMMRLKIVLRYKWQVSFEAITLYHLRWSQIKNNQKKNASKNGASHSNTMAALKNAHKVLTLHFFCFFACCSAPVLLHCKMMFAKSWKPVLIATCGDVILKLSIPCARDSLEGLTFFDCWFHNTHAILVDGNSSRTISKKNQRKCVYIKNAIRSSSIELMNVSGRYESDAPMTRYGWIILKIATHFSVSQQAARVRAFALMP